MGGSGVRTGSKVPKGFEAGQGTKQLEALDSQMRLEAMKDYEPAGPKMQGWSYCVISVLFREFPGIYIEFKLHRVQICNLGSKYVILGSNMLFLPQICYFCPKTKKKQLRKFPEQLRKFPEQLRKFPDTVFRTFLMPFYGCTGAVFLKMAELQGSSSTVGASSESLLRGAMILDGVAANGVIKEEPDDEERKILEQIEARLPQT